MKTTNHSRRDFVKKSAYLSAGITVVPSFTVSGLGHKAPSDKLNIVGIGVGGKGHPNLVGMNTENIIGLCDVDWKYAQACFNEFPKAKPYMDWRKMFDELGNRRPYPRRDCRFSVDHGQACLLPEAAYPFGLRVAAADPPGGQI